MKINVLIFSTIFVSLVFGCARKAVTTFSEQGKIAASDTVDLSPLEMFNEIDFNYFTSKAKLEFTDGTEDVKGKMSIRMKKDSLIWLSIYGTALNVEAIRALITTDSIFIQDYLNKTFSAYDFEALSQKIKFDVDFDIAQALIIGNMPRKKRRSDKFSRGKDFYLVKQQEGYTFIDNYFGSLSNKLEKVEIQDTPSNRSLELSYSDFMPVDDKKIMAQSSTVNLKYKENGRTYYTVLSIKHQRSEFTDKVLDFPFKRQF